MEAPTDARKLAERLRSLREAPIIPFALELLNAEASRKVGLPERPMILVEVGGNAAAVEAQIDALRTLGTVADAAPEMWDALRQRNVAETTVFRASGLPAALPERWEKVARFAAATAAQ
jgi:hypothetical protein